MCARTCWGWNRRAGSEANLVLASCSGFELRKALLCQPEPEAKHNSQLLATPGVGASGWAWRVVTRKAVGRKKSHWSVGSRPGQGCRCTIYVAHSHPHRWCLHDLNKLRLRHPTKEPGAFSATPYPTPYPLPQPPSPCPVPPSSHKSQGMYTPGGCPPGLLHPSRPQG